MEKEYQLNQLKPQISRLERENKTLDQAKKELEAKLEDFEMEVAALKGLLMEEGNKENMRKY